MGIVLLFAGPVFAQKKTDSLGAWLDKIYAEQENKNLKSYYVDRPTANLCEAWYSCAKWAFEEYEKDQSFKIVKAALKKQRRVLRHKVITEKHLFIEATYTNRTVRLEFKTPKATARTRAYNYITKFPK